MPYPAYKLGPTPCIFKVEWLELIVNEPKHNEHGVSEGGYTGARYTGHGARGTGHGTRSSEYGAG